jgi:hypothetical protein
MAKPVKTKNRSSRLVVADKRIQIYLIAIPVIVFLLKMIMMFNIKGGGWYGADGENYTKGVEGLVDNGFFSNEPKLSYWPAGYPVLMWPIAELTVVNFFYIISFLQAIFFAYATYYFTKNLSHGQLRFLAIVGSFFISFNPTLSLSTFSVGYEAPIASIFMMTFGLIHKFLLTKDQNGKSVPKPLIYAAAWMTLAIFMQPRFIISAIALILPCALMASSKVVRLKLVSATLLILMISPAVLMYRNSNAIGQSVISNNLGVTMAIGAGPETTGSYVHKGPDVPCEPKEKNSQITDNDKVKCVMGWYLKNPLKTIELSYNKTKFFWSPWSGPLADGTMARNPWLNISPAYTVIKNKEGAELVLGGFGKAVSYLWIFGQMFFLFLGFWQIIKVFVKNRIFVYLLISPVIFSWLISIGTIGDHRFRIPTMPLSLLFQVAGFLVIKNKLATKL